jgi:iron-sulfur cluster assembly accessory protein
MQSLNITVTDAAKKHLNKHLKVYENAYAFKLYLKPDGCSGYQFELDPLRDKSHAHVKVLDILYLDEAWANYVAGLVIDIELQGIIGYKLKYTLPEARDYCGCGKSFQIDKKNVGQINE